MPNSFTPQQIEQFLQEFFDVVGARQYIGARYVPIFGRAGEDTVEWDDGAPYEPLTVVMHLGVSYVSRRYVPQGIQVTNTDYWVETYRYNAQVEQYRQEVLQYDDKIMARVPYPIDSSQYGTQGQVLSSLGNGATEWVDPVIPSDDQAEAVITEWLDAHPEATTTVQDGAITTQKLANGAVTNDKIADDTIEDVKLIKVNGIRTRESADRGTVESLLQRMGTVEGYLIEKPDNLLPVDNMLVWKHGAYNNENPWIISPTDHVNINNDSTTTYYAFWDGVDFGTYPNLGFKIFAFNANNERVINSTLLSVNNSTRTITLSADISYVYFDVTAEDGSVYLPLSFLQDEGIRLYFGKTQILTSEQYDALYNTPITDSFDRAYDGESLDLSSGGTFSITRFTSLSPGDISTYGHAQGFDIYDGKLFQLHQSGYLRVIDIETQSVIGTIQLDVMGHGNCCQFANVKEFQDDLTPVLYVSSWQSPYSIYAYRINQNLTSVLYKTFRSAAIGQEGSKIDFIVNDKTAFALSTYTSSTHDPTDNYMIVRQYNMDVSISPDDIYWMSEVSDSTFTIPFIPVMQDAKYLNGKIFVLSSPGTDPYTKIYVIDPFKKIITNIITDLTDALRNYELEGLAFFDDGMTNLMIVGQSAYDTFSLRFR